jgi:hypothetical protein
LVSTRIVQASRNQPMHPEVAHGVQRHRWAGPLADPVELGLIESYAHPVQTAADIAQAYEVFATVNAEVVVVEQSNMLLTAAQVIAQAAAAKKLPTLYGYDA